MKLNDGQWLVLAYTVIVIAAVIIGIGLSDAV